MPSSLRPAGATGNRPGVHSWENQKKDYSSLPKALAGAPSFRVRCERVGIRDCITARVGHNPSPRRFGSPASNPLVDPVNPFPLKISPLTLNDPEIYPMSPPQPSDSKRPLGEGVYPKPNKDSYFSCHSLPIFLVVSTSKSTACSAALPRFVTNASATSITHGAKSLARVPVPGPAPIATPKALRRPSRACLRSRMPTPSRWRSCR